MCECRIAFQKLRWCQVFVPRQLPAEITIEPGCFASESSGTLPLLDRQQLMPDIGSRGCKARIEIAGGDSEMAGQAARQSDRDGSIPEKWRRYEGLDSIVSDTFVPRKR
jgi:hypothetical protein